MLSLRKIIHFGLLLTSFFQASAFAQSAKERVLEELEKYGSNLQHTSQMVSRSFDKVQGQKNFDWQTWREATKLLEEESALNYSILKSIVENTGRIQSPHGILSSEKEAMLYTLRALLRRKLRMTKNRLPWTFLLGQTQFFLGHTDNFYLRYYIQKGKDPEQLTLAREMLAQINP